MATLSLPWGEGTFACRLPEHWKLQQVADTALQPAGPDWPRRLASAINQPVSGPPLAKLLQARRNGKVLLIVEDMTRHSPLPEILDVLLREIHHADVPDENLQVLFATGMHPAMTAEQARRKIGRLAETLRWRSNPWRDADAYAPLGRAGALEVAVDRGVLEADLRIVISSVSPHLQAGFGGGYKMFVPGCASLETIRALHRLGVERRPRPLAGTVAEDNRMRSAIDAAGARIEQAGGATFAVQYVLDEHDLPTHIAAGELLPVQRMLAKQCAAACGVVVEEPADVLITNAHPRDYDLWQSFKCIANTRWAARPNGVILCTTRCEAGLHGMDVPPWPLSPTWTRRAVRLLGHAALASLITRAAPSLAGDAAFFVQMGLQAIHRNPILLVSPALHASAQRFPGLDLFASFEEAVAAATDLLGGGPQRVIAFPNGGATFPVLPGTHAARRPT